MPETMNEPTTTNRARFLSAYVNAYTRVLEENAGDYAGALDYGKRVYRVETAREVAEAMAPRMVDALANGTACNGKAIAATARALGVKPTLSAIRDYLNA